MAPVMFLFDLPPAREAEGADECKSARIAKRQKDQSLMYPHATCSPSPITRQLFGLRWMQSGFMLQQLNWELVDCLMHSPALSCGQVTYCFASLIMATARTRMPHE